MERKKVARYAAIAVAGAALIGGGSAAYAATSGTQTNNNIMAGCFSSKGSFEWLEMSQVPHGCADGYILKTWSITGPAGPQGPSGVVSTKTTDLGAMASVPTGGSFVTNAPEVGTGISLEAGTYLISLNAKATPPSGGTGTVEIFPQFFVYNQVKNTAFTGDVLNVGSGALESGTHATIDSYFSGAATVTLTQATTLHVYAFGYDSDTSAGHYILDDLSVTATEINP